MGKRLSLVEVMLDAAFILIGGEAVEDVKELNGGVQVLLSEGRSNIFNEQVVELAADGIAQAVDWEGNVVTCSFSSMVPYAGPEPSKVDGSDERCACSMKVSLDGGLNFIDARHGVRVIYESVDVPGQEGKGQMHVTLSEEGMVRDVWVTRDEPLDHNMGTESETVEEAVSAMVEEGS